MEFRFSWPSYGQNGAISNGASLPLFVVASYPQHLTEPDCSNAHAWLKPATTDAHTAVLLADFYRAGDGNNESFTAQIIVADRDIAPDIPGVQNLWVQGVGCGTAIVNFN